MKLIPPQHITGVDVGGSWRAVDPDDGTIDVPAEFAGPLLADGWTRFVPAVPAEQPTQAPAGDGEHQ